MSEFNRVFITGRSALTASGATALDTWNSLMAGKCGIEEINQWDLSSWTHRLGGELKDFKPAQLLPDRKLIKVISRQDVMGIHAAVEAIKHSKFLEYRDTLESVDSFNDQTGVFVGSPGNKYFQQYDFVPLIAKTKNNMEAFAHQLFDEVHPMWLLRILPNNVLAYTGITYGFKGPNHNIANHACGGMQAILEAYWAIKSGQIERAVVVAYDMGIEPQALMYYAKLGLISPNQLKPFDKEQDGTILAEGAACLILESEACVRQRKASCYGEILGGLSATENMGLFTIEAEGQSLSTLIQNTLIAANQTAKDINMIVAHGNGNVRSDTSEALAFKRIFGEGNMPVTGFKWSMGHTLAASGLLDTVLSTYALENRCIPGIAPLNEPIAAGKGLILSSDHQNLDANATALIVNRGLASMNACLVVKACD